MYRFRFKEHIDSLIAAIIGMVLVILFTSHSGIGISPDSIVYTSGARNLLQGRGFTDFSGHPLVLFPLFYPSFLALVMFFFRLDIIVLAPYLNALMYGMLIFISGVILEKFKYKTLWYKRIILAIITLSPSLIEIYTMLWSETLFILLSLIFILYFHRYFLTHKTGDLIKAALVVSLAFDTRYAGVTLVGTGVVLLFFDKNTGWKVKVKNVVLFGATGISLVVLNLIRNEMVRGLATGMRQKGITPLMKNVEYSGTVLSDWFSIQLNRAWYFEILAVVVMSLFIFYFIRNINHWKSYYTFENIAVAFFIVYVLFIIVSSTISRYETINNRLLAPVFLPLLWISTCQIPKWRTYMPHRKLNFIFLSFTIGIAGLLIASYLLINSENLSYMQESGIPGYTEDTWQQSDIVSYLHKHPEIFNKEAVIYSNHAQAVYFLTGHSVKNIPERVYVKEVNEFNRRQSCLLIWFNMDLNTDLLSLREIGKYKKIHCLYTFSDGAIYSLKYK